MSYTITEVEIAKTLDDWQGKGAKVFRYTVEGDDRRPEDFVVNGTEPKKVGDTVEIEDGDFGPRVKKAPKGGGGFKRSPAETAAIQRQHSQEQALRREANLIAAGVRGPFNEQELRSVINWFEADIKSKDRGVQWDGFSSDIPADQEGLPI